MKENERKSDMRNGEAAADFLEGHRGDYRGVIR